MFSDRLKYLRTEKNLTQRDLANILDITSGAIGMYESGKRFPNSEILNKIADYFGVSMDYLMGRTDDPYTSTQITKKESDIAKKMRKLREEIANEDGLMLDGEILSEETKELLLQLLEKDEIAATLNNKKYIPKKHRK